MFLDSFFRSVLYHQNHLGPSIFNNMYKKNSIQEVFSFLNEKTNVREDLKIINSFHKIPFLKELARMVIH